MAAFENLSPGVTIVLPDSVTNESQALLTFPSLGDTAKHESLFTPVGNSLKDALSFVDALGAIIVVAERPRPTLYEAWTTMRTNPQDAYNEIAKRHAETTARAIGSSTLRIKKLSVYGESAGATFGLAVTRTQELPITSVAAYDPIGLFNTKFSLGLRKFLHYSFAESIYFNNIHPLPDQSGYFQQQPHQPAPHKMILGGLAMAGRQSRDILTNGNVWASDITLENIRYLRDEMPGVGMLIVLPESSLAISKGLADRNTILSLLNHKDQASRQAPYSVVEVPDFSHSSVNDPPVHLKLAQLALAYGEHA